MGLEPTTYGLQSRRSSQLSYAPLIVNRGRSFQRSKHLIERTLSKQVLYQTELRPSSPVPVTPGRGCRS